MDRRQFLQSAALAAAPASEKVTIGIMGVRGRGRALTGAYAAMPDVNIAYLCDVDQGVTGRAVKEIENARRPPAKFVGDFRRILEDKSVDALVIATPDHWHAPATIMACDAGKDVYVEKPASHNLREGRLMVQAARRNRRIVQLGTQGRSHAATMEAMAFIRSGKIGKVLMAKAFDVQLRQDIGRKPDAPVPPGVDYDTWIGPAPALPFNQNRFHYTWHWHWNYGTGDAGNDGIHQLDQARWALGVDAPVEVTGGGRKLFFQDDQQTPDTINVTYHFPEGKALIFEMRIWCPYGMEGQDNAIAVYGSEGMIQVGRWGRVHGYKLFDNKGKEVLFRDAKMAAGETQEGRGEAHARNFIDCVRSRKAPNAEIEIGHKSTILTHLANVVVKTGRNIKFDPKTETIPGDAEANRLLGRTYRKHWAAPNTDHRSDLKRVAEPRA